MKWVHKTNDYVLSTNIAPHTYTHAHTEHVVESIIIETIIISLLVQQNNDDDDEDDNEKKTDWNNRYIYPSTQTEQ